MRTGDIAFIEERIPILSKSINAIAKIPYSHTGVIVMEHGTPVLISARGKGIVPEHFPTAVKNKRYEIHRPNLYQDELKYKEKAWGFVGTNYDYRGLLWHQFVWNVFGIWLGAKKEEDAMIQFYCYEFSAMMSGYKEWWKVKPKNFYEDLTFKHK